MFSARCSNGDVRVSNNIPEIYWDGDWHLLCGHCFEPYGPRKFCSVLGYESGTTKIQQGNVTTYAQYAFFKGNCTKEDKWSDCSGNCSVKMSGKKIFECLKGQKGLQIECSGGFKPKNSSC